MTELEKLADKVEHDCNHSINKTNYEYILEALRFIEKETATRCAEISRNHKDIFDLPSKHGRLIAYAIEQVFGLK